MTAAAASDDVPLAVPVPPRLRVVGSPDASRIAALEDEITSLAGHLAAATARFCKLLADFDAAGGWQAHGLRSCAQWLSWKCGMGVTAAREHVRVAKSLTTLPVVQEAFAAGRLSFSKVRAITRVATPTTEAALVETARSSTASQLDRICSGVKRARAADEVLDHRSRARFSATWREDGTLTFSGCLPPEDGAALLAAIAAFKADPIRREAGAGQAAGPVAPADGLPEDAFRDPGMLAARADAEALVMLARHGLDSPPEQVLADHVRLIVHVTEPEAAVPDTGPAGAAPTSTGATQAPTGATQAPAGAAADDPAPAPSPPTSAEASSPVGILDAGPGVPLLPLSPSTLERLACGAVVEEVQDPDQAGKRSSRKRFATQRQRRALLRRDGGCRFAGCPRKRGLHAHHVVHYSRGGPTTMANLLLLCDHHHLLVHEGGWRLEASADGWVAVSPAGVRHGDAPPTEGDGDRLPEAHPATIRPDTVTGNWAGGRFDLPYVVSVLATG